MHSTTDFSKHKILTFILSCIFCYFGWSSLDIFKNMLEDKLQRVQIKKERTKNKKNIFVIIVWVFFLKNG